MAIFRQEAFSMWHSQVLYKFNTLLRKATETVSAAFFISFSFL